LGTRIGIGFLLIFGFAAWLAGDTGPRLRHRAPVHRHGNRPDATLAATGGFFIPIIFGHLVSRTGFDTGWIFLAIVSLTCALRGLAGRNHAAASSRPTTGTSFEPGPGIASAEGATTVRSAEKSFKLVRTIRGFPPRPVRTAPRR
jgi:hypothetical protein